MESHHAEAYLKNPSAYVFLAHKYDAENNIYWVEGKSGLRNVLIILLKNVTAHARTIQEWWHSIATKPIWIGTISQGYRDYTLRLQDQSFEGIEDEEYSNVEESSDHYLVEIKKKFWTDQY